MIKGISIVIVSLLFSSKLLVEIWMVCLSGLELPNITCCNPKSIYDVPLSENKHFCMKSSLVCYNQLLPLQDSDEVVIFAPPPKPTAAQNKLELDQDNTVSSSAGNHKEMEQEAEPKEREPISCENTSDLPNQMPGIDFACGLGAANALMDSVHDFGAGEMPQVNEGFVPASEGESSGEMPQVNEGFVPASEGESFQECRQ